MLGWKLNHVSKRGPWCLSLHFPCRTVSRIFVSNNHFLPIQYVNITEWYVKSWNWWQIIQIILFTYCLLILNDIVCWYWQTQLTSLLSLAKIECFLEAYSLAYPYNGRVNRCSINTTRLCSEWLSCQRCAIDMPAIAGLSRTALTKGAPMSDGSN